MIALKRPAKAPAILEEKGKEETKKLCSEFDAYGEIKTKIKNDIYGDCSVRETLEEAQKGKCCYCECELKGYGDVEHFRPKGGYKQNKDSNLSKHGYYWLAYFWDNLMLSCQICNQRYKKNLFPLVDDSKRALKHSDDINKEEPLFINPFLEDPKKYISFENAAIIPINDKGKITIKELGLDRDGLEEDRRTILNKIIKWHETMILCLYYPDEDKLLKHAKKLKKDISDAAQNFSEYAGMVQAWLDKNPLPKENVS
jgi:uncharacterized protein (TIGR02646 family)